MLGLGKRFSLVSSNTVRKFSEALLIVSLKCTPPTMSSMGNVASVCNANGDFT